MSRYIISILFILLSFTSFAQTDVDTTAEPEPKKVIVDTFHQLRFGADISKPIINAINKTVYSYELEADYYLHREVYGVIDGGWGGINVNYADSMHTDTITYSSRNVFFKAGVNKCMLTRLFPGDWDIAYVGARYAIGLIQRSDATYTIKDNFWGTTRGVIPAQNLTMHWFEVVGGVKVELYKGIFLGWDVRGKFRLNRSAFKELPPAYISGYGKGDKGSIFDFNFYINYAIRW